MKAWYDVTEEDQEAILALQLHGMPPIMDTLEVVDIHQDS